MAKGISIKYKSYGETVSKILDLIKFEREIEKHDKIVLKPSLSTQEGKSTDPAFVKEVLKYCLENKKPNAEIFIAEGADGEETMDLFNHLGYKNLAELYNIGLIDLNNTEVEEIKDPDFLKFEKIFYPKILLDSFVISLPKLADDEETNIQASLSNMLGAYPAQFYQGIFARGKNKLRKWPLKYSVHDIAKCKLPEFTIIDASEQGQIISGVPFEMDKQASKLLGKDWETIGYLDLLTHSPKKEESIPNE